MTVVVPIETVSEANRRGHWAIQANRAKDQRKHVACCLLAQRDKLPWSERYAVTLTRVCPPRNQIRDRDNLASALKAVRDEVAQQIGVDDADLTKQGLVRWEYRQVTAKGTWSVMIRIEGAP